MRSPSLRMGNIALPVGKLAVGFRHKQSLRASETLMWRYRAAGAHAVPTDFADAQASHLFLELMAEDRIAIAQQVARELGRGKGLPQLLDYPFRGWVGGNLGMQNAPPVMGQHQAVSRALQ